MVSQGDITLLQRIRQARAQSQSLPGSTGPVCGEREEWEEGYRSPLHTALQLGLLSGENEAFEPTQAWQGVS